MEKYGVDIVSFPEFLSEDTAMKDAADPWAVAVGGKSAGCFLEAHKEFFDSISNRVPVFSVCESNTEVEMTKYAVNCLFATLIIFGNQIYDACRQAGCDYNKVASALRQLPFRDQHHLDVFHKNYRGYGGKCLPKDVWAFVMEYFYRNPEFGLLEAVHGLNLMYLSNVVGHGLTDHKP